MIQKLFLLFNYNFNTLIAHKFHRDLIVFISKSDCSIKK